MMLMLAFAAGWLNAIARRAAVIVMVSYAIHFRDDRKA
jgi:hypothetical protein